MRRQYQQNSDIFLIHRWGIYYWIDFRFSNGTQRTKYWIALNCKVINPVTKEEETIPSLIPTSQWNKYAENRKKLIDTIVIECGESSFFDKKTVVDLKNIQYVSLEKIECAIKSSRLKYVGLLEENIIKKIEYVIESAETLGEIIKKQLLCKT